MCFSTWNPQVKCVNDAKVFVDRKFFAEIRRVIVINRRNLSQKWLFIIQFLRIDKRLICSSFKYIFQHPIVWIRNSTSRTPEASKLVGKRLRYSIDMEESGFKFKNVGHQYCATMAGTFKLHIAVLDMNLRFHFCFSQFDYAWTWCRDWVV